MGGITERILYWTRFQYEDWKMYVAATTEGLSYIGSPNAKFEELEQWQKKRLSTYQLIEDEKVLQPYCAEIKAYFTGEHTTYNLPLDLHGTLFQQQVWEALQKLEYGQIVTYTDIAGSIGKPKSVRAVGSAIGANPVLFFVPCHRVIAKSGRLGGFRAGLELKKALLKLEEKDIK